MASLDKGDSKMSGNFISGEGRRSRSYGNTSQRNGKKSMEKPIIELYRPGMGMQPRRTNETSKAAGDSWREETNKAPRIIDSTPASVDQNPLVSSKNNSKFECTLKSLNNQMSTLTVNTEITQVVDLTLSPSPGSEDRIRAKKPEQALYVPKRSETKSKFRGRKGKNEEEQENSQKPMKWNPKPSNFDSLAPRLQKKYLEERGGFGNGGEEQWNGGSMLFQGRGKGRGRGYVKFRKGEERNGAVLYKDSRRDIKNSSSDDKNKGISVKSPEKAPQPRQPSPTPLPAPSTPPPTKVTPSQSAPLPSIDWNDLIEMEEQQQQLSRSSSANSLHNVQSAPLFPCSNTALPNVRDTKRSGEKKGGKERGRRPSESSDKGRERNKGHYRFHNTSSRESSRERTWRRTSESSDKMDTNWRATAPQPGEPLSWRNATSAKDSKPKLGRGVVHVPVPIQQETGGGSSQRKLFDPNNPGRPIIVSGTGRRGTENPEKNVPHQFTSKENHPRQPNLSQQQAACMASINMAEIDLQFALNSAKKYEYDLTYWWQRIITARNFLMRTFEEVVTKDMVFCLNMNIESRLWKLVYYETIEFLKKAVAEDVKQKDTHKQVLTSVLEEGLKFYETVLIKLETTYQFKIDCFLTGPEAPPKSRAITHALHIAQKIFIYLGDLSRYRELANETNNFVKAKQYYTNAQILDPISARPYYQLGVIAFAARRKLDAIYYYVRSLMVPVTPLLSAKESLVSLFDENRKKYELTNRRVQSLAAATIPPQATNVRREIWVRPTDGRRVHRTSTAASSDNVNGFGDEVVEGEVDLAELTPVEINKRFTLTYLMVHGKLFSKVGMETFQEVGIQMLREFRALLQHRPLPLGWIRFLQLIALNIFAIEHTQLKEDNLSEPGYRSAIQENALIISLQMFNLMLERCLQLLREQVANNMPNLNEDVTVLLPAIKVWCDWLLSHGPVWNPPPCCSDFRVGPPGDPWQRLAALVNFLGEHTMWRCEVATKPLEGYELVRLPEDSSLYGFKPLMYNIEYSSVYIPPDLDMEAATCCLRFHKILFFCTQFLCGLDPPVLKVERQESCTIYKSVVNTPGPAPVSTIDDVEQSDDEDLIVESFSEGEDEESGDEKFKVPIEDCTDIKKLLQRKEQLERRHMRQERHRKRVQTILEQNGLSVVIEVRPRYLVTDTNCFIDYLPHLKTIANCSSGPEPHYILNVPLIVINELEGLARGGRCRDMSNASLKVKGQAASVSEDAKEALAFLKNPARHLPTVRCVTLTGKVINSFTSFAVEDICDKNIKNDDKILETCLSLCKNLSYEEISTSPGQPRRIKRDVVLLTEDRHLRLKAIARDVPVREVPDFVQWAGLG